MTSIKTLLASVVFEKLSYRLIGICQLPIGNPLDVRGFRAYTVTNYER